MKRLLPLLALSALLASCVSSPSKAYKHWSAESVAPSMARHFLGFDPDRDGDYGDRFGMDMNSIGRTLERHFMNRNRENPLQGRVDGK